MSIEQGCTNLIFQIGYTSTHSRLISAEHNGSLPKAAVLSDRHKKTDMAQLKNLWLLSHRQTTPCDC